MARKMPTIRMEIYFGDLWADIIVQPDPVDPSRGVVVCLDADDGFPAWRGKKIGTLHREASRWRGYHRQRHVSADLTTRAASSAGTALRELVGLGFFEQPWESASHGTDQQLVADLFDRVDGRDPITGLWVLRDAAA